MMQKSRAAYRLSPNEETLLLRQEKERRRKLRIQQVREQERQFAKQIRDQVQGKRDREVRILAGQLEQEWLESKLEKCELLEEAYRKTLETVGKAHTAAEKQPPYDEIRKRTKVANDRKARDRGQQAIQKQLDENDRRLQEEFALIMTRKTALEIERARAALIAKKPKRQSDPTPEESEVPEKTRVLHQEGFSMSHYTIQPAEYAEKAELEEQGNAKEGALREEERLKEEQQDRVREQEERQTKAALRQKHAHRKERLRRDYERLQTELGQMEQADRRRRQLVVSNIPKQIFQPPPKRLEEREENQKDMEQAFENMYMANTDYAGDIELALEPSQPPAEAALDVSSDTPGEDFQVPEPRRFPRGLDQTRPTKKDTLKRLLQKIHTQKQDHMARQEADLTSGRVATQELLDGPPTRMLSTDGSSTTSAPTTSGFSTDGLTAATSTDGQSASVSSTGSPSVGLSSIRSSGGTSSTGTTDSSRSGEASTGVPSELSEHPLGSSDGSSQVTPNGLASLETGPLSSSSADTMLMHPMEEARRHRQMQTQMVQQGAATQQAVKRGVMEPGHFEPLQELASPSIPETSPLNLQKDGGIHLENGSSSSGGELLVSPATNLRVQSDSLQEPQNKSHDSQLEQSEQHHELCGTAIGREHEHHGPSSAGPSALDKSPHQVGEIYDGGRRSIGGSMHLGKPSEHQPPVDQASSVDAAYQRCVSPGAGRRGVLASEPSMTSQGVESGNSLLKKVPHQPRRATAGRGRDEGQQPARCGGGGGVLSRDGRLSEQATINKVGAVEMDKSANYLADLPDSHLEGVRRRYPHVYEALTGRRPEDELVQTKPRYSEFSLKCDVNSSQETHGDGFNREKDKQRPSIPSDYPRLADGFGRDRRKADSAQEQAIDKETLYVSQTQESTRKSNSSSNSSMSHAGRKATQKEPDSEFRMLLHDYQEQLKKLQKTNKTEIAKAQALLLERRQRLLRLYPQMQQTGGITGTAHMQQTGDINRTALMQPTGDITGTAHMQQTGDITRTAHMQPTGDITRNAHMQQTGDISGTAHMQPTGDITRTAHMQRTADISRTAHMQQIRDMTTTAHMQQSGDLSETTHMHKTTGRSGTAHIHQTGGLSKTTHVQQTGSLPGTAHIQQTWDLSTVPEVHQTGSRSGAFYTPQEWGGQQESNRQQSVGEWRDVGLPVNKGLRQPFRGQLEAYHKGKEEHRLEIEREVTVRDVEKLQTGENVIPLSSAGREVSDRGNHYFPEDLGRIAQKKDTNSAQKKLSALKDRDIRVSPNVSEWMPFGNGSELVGRASHPDIANVNRRGSELSHSQGKGLSYSDPSIHQLLVDSENYSRPPSHKGGSVPDVRSSSLQRHPVFRDGIGSSDFSRTQQGREDYTSTFGSSSEDENSPGIALREPRRVNVSIVSDHLNLRKNRIDQERSSATSQEIVEDMTSPHVSWRPVRELRISMPSMDLAEQSPLTDMSSHLSDSVPQLPETPLTGSRVDEDHDNEGLLTPRTLAHTAPNDESDAVGQEAPAVGNPHSEVSGSSPGRLITPRMISEGSAGTFPQQHEGSNIAAILRDIKNVRTDPSQAQQMLQSIEPTESNQEWFHHQQNNRNVESQEQNVQFERTVRGQLKLSSDTGLLPAPPDDNNGTMDSKMPDSRYMAEFTQFGMMPYHRTGSAHLLHEQPLLPSGSVNGLQYWWHKGGLPDQLPQSQKIPSADSEGTTSSQQDSMQAGSDPKTEEQTASETTNGDIPGTLRVHQGVHLPQEPYQRVGMQEQVATSDGVARDQLELLTDSQQRTRALLDGRMIPYEETNPVRLPQGQSHQSVGMDQFSRGTVHSREIIPGDRHLTVGGSGEERSWDSPHDQTDTGATTKQYDESGSKKDEFPDDHQISSLTQPLSGQGFPGESSIEEPTDRGLLEALRNLMIAKARAKVPGATPSNTSYFSHLDLSKPASEGEDFQSGSTDDTRGILPNYPRDSEPIQALRVDQSGLEPTDVPEEDMGDTSERYKVHHRPPVASYSKLQAFEEMTPHELSTILEVDSLQFETLPSSLSFTAGRNGSPLGMKQDDSSLVPTSTGDSRSSLDWGTQHHTPSVKLSGTDSSQEIYIHQPMMVSALEEQPLDGSQESPLRIKSTAGTSSQTNETTTSSVIFAELEMHEESLRLLPGATIQQVQKENSEGNISLPEGPQSTTTDSSDYQTGQGEETHPSQRAQANVSPFSMSSEVIRRRMPQLSFENSPPVSVSNSNDSWRKAQSEAEVESSWKADAVPSERARPSHLLRMDHSSSWEASQVSGVPSLPVDYEGKRKVSGLERQPASEYRIPPATGMKIQESISERRPPDTSASDAHTLEEGLLGEQTLEDISEGYLGLEEGPLDDTLTEESNTHPSGESDPATSCDDSFRPIQPQDESKEHAPKEQVSRETTGDPSLSCTPAPGTSVRVVSSVGLVVQESPPDGIRMEADLMERSRDTERPRDVSSIPSFSGMSVSSRFEFPPVSGDRSVDSADKRTDARVETPAGNRSDMHAFIGHQTSAPSHAESKSGGVLTGSSREEFRHEDAGGAISFSGMSISRRFELPPVSSSQKVELFNDLSGMRRVGQSSSSGSNVISNISSRGLETSHERIESISPGESGAREVTSIPSFSGILTSSRLPLPMVPGWNGSPDELGNLRMVSSNGMRRDAGLLNPRLYISQTENQLGAGTFDRMEEAKFKNASEGPSLSSISLSSRFDLPPAFSGRREDSPGDDAGMRSPQLGSRTMSSSEGGPLESTRVEARFKDITGIPEGVSASSTSGMNADCHGLPENLMGKETPTPGVGFGLRETTPSFSGISSRFDLPSVASGSKVETLEMLSSTQGTPTNLANSEQEFRIPPHTHDNTACSPFSTRSALGDGRMDTLLRGSGLSEGPLTDTGQESKTRDGGVFAYSPSLVSVPTRQDPRVEGRLEEGPLESTREEFVHRDVTSIPSFSGISERSEQHAPHGRATLGGYHMESSGMAFVMRYSASISKTSMHFESLENLGEEGSLHPQKPKVWDGVDGQSSARSLDEHPATQGWTMSDTEQRPDSPSGQLLEEIAADGQQGQRGGGLDHHEEKEDTGTQASAVTGILEEPELTFQTTFDTDVTLSSVAEGERDAGEGEDATPSNSLLSFIRHEEQFAHSTPMKTEGREATAPNHEEDNVQPNTNTNAQDQSESLTLQEALVRRKAKFIKASQSRQTEVKGHRESKMTHSTGFSSTLKNWQRAKLQAQRNSKKNGDGKKSTQADKENWSVREKAPPKTSQDRKAAQKADKERTKRLYNQLEEVKTRQVEADRKRAYAENRRKRKEYEEKLKKRRALKQQQQKKN